MGWVDLEGGGGSRGGWVSLLDLLDWLSDSGLVGTHGGLTVVLREEIGDIRQEIRVVAPCDALSRI